MPTEPLVNRIAHLSNIGTEQTDFSAPLSKRIADFFTTTPESTDGTWITKKRTPLDKLLGKTEITRDESFNVEDFRNRIVGVENETLLASGGDLYKSIGVSGDLGKYQTSPNTLADWSKVWLGKKYTPKEFLNDEKAQEEFFTQFTEVAKRHKLTPEEAAIAWHRGWGEVGTGPKETRGERLKAKIKEQMKEAPATAYLAKFNKQ